MEQAGHAANSIRTPMSRRAALPLWLLVLNALLVMAVTMLAVRVWTLQEVALPKKQMTALRLVMRQILEHHIEEHEAGALMDEAIDGLVHSLDSYSDYVPAKDVKVFEEDNTGSYEGIGVTLLPDQIPATVLYPHLGSPAERAGILPGDSILAVGGVALPTDSRPTPPVGERIRGPAGTPVVVTIGRGEEAPREVQIVRGGVVQPSVRWVRILDREHGVGYLHLSAFHPTSADEVDRAVESLLARGAKAIVLDLRHDLGGLLDQAVRIANRFLPAGNIVSLKKRGGIVDEAHDAKPELCRWPDLPLVVLVNRHSASASEVLAGALQDHHRARIVGERSYGKGFVQSIYRWQDEDFRLKLTTGHYYTPAGRDIDRRMRPVRFTDKDTGRTGIRWDPIPLSEQKERDAGGIPPDVLVTVEAALFERIRSGLNELEVPERWREAAEALAKRRGYSIRAPLGPDQDPQLARALLEAWLPSEATSRPSSGAGK